MKRKDFVSYGDREGVVLMVLGQTSVDGEELVIWQDMTVVLMKTGMTTTNHPMVLKSSELKSKKKRDYKFTAYTVSVTRVTEKAIGCTIDGLDFYVPKSLCNVADSVAKNEGDTGELLIADWWFERAKKEKEEKMAAPSPFSPSASPSSSVPDDGIPF